MSSGAKVKLSTGKRLRILSEHLIRARIHYDLWWFLEGEDTFPRIRDTLNDFSEFFLFDINAHFTSLIIRSAVIWDETKGVVSLPKIAKDILDPARFPQHNDILDEIEQLKAAAAGIVTIRHESIAHISDKKDRSEVFRKAMVIPDNLPVMMDSWLDVVNKLRSMQRPVMNACDFRELPLRHLEGLIRRLGGPDLSPRNLMDEVFGS